MRVSYRKVGGLHFIKLGRFTFMACRSRRKPAPKPVNTFRLTDDGKLVMGWVNYE